MDGHGLIPALRTPRLILRGPTLADVNAYRRHFVDERVVRTLSHRVPWPYPDDGVMRYIRHHVLPNQGRGRWCWGLFRRDRPEEIIGMIELWRNGTPEHRGFWLGHAFWGQGFMTEANVAVLDHAFDVLGFQRMIFVNAVGNTASRRIKEKTGCTLLGRQPGRFVDPGLTEQEVWSLTPAAWQQARPALVDARWNVL